MRIRRLLLERFGHFTDRAFDFGPAGEGRDFHIIYGPNEAGKTTTMEAVLRLFYGFPLREPYAFKHPRQNLQVSATLEIDGTPRQFTRRPTRSASLVDDTGTALPETALSAHLAGLSEEDYRRLLCLDDDTIERGGEEIARAEGDIGRLLFSAAAGVADLSAVLDGVRDRAEAIWKKRGRATRMAELKRALAEVEKEIREHDITASAWRALKRDLANAREGEEAARAARDGLNATRARTEAQRRALPLMTEIDALEAAVAPFAAYPDRLDVDPERLIELRGDRGVAAENVERLTGELAALREARAGLAVDPARQALAAALDALEDLAARDRGAGIDRGKREEEQRAAEAEMRQAARDLGLLSPEADPRALVLSAPDIAALEEARDRLRTAEARAEGEAREVAELRERVAAAADAQEDTAPGPEGAPVGALLLRFDADSLAPAHAAALQAIAAARLKADRALAALATGGVTFATLPPCPTSRAQAAEWTERHRDLTAELRTVAETREAHLSDLAARAAQAEALAEGVQIVNDAEAADLLARRDARWTDHLAALDRETATAFHAAMRDHDAAAAARLARSRELAQLREIGQAEAEARARAARADTRLQALRQERAEIEAAVGAAAAQAGLAADLAPAEWLDWVIRHAAAAEEARTVSETEAAHAPVLRRGAALLAELARVLPNAPDLSGALAAARRLAEAERGQAEARAKAEEALRQARRDLARREARETAARGARGAAEAEWRGLIRDRLGAAPCPDRLMASLEPLRALREQEARRAAAERRVATMRADQELFAREVAALARAHDLPECETAARTYAALRDLAEQDRATREEIAKLDRAIEDAEAERDENEERLRRIAQDTRAIAAGFPDGAALADIDALREAAGRAQQVIRDRQALDKLRRTVLSELGVDDIAAARAELADLTAAGLEARLGSLRSDLAHAEEDLSRAIRDRAAAEHALAGVRGDDRVAALVERKATLELELEAAALEHLELSLGHRQAADAIRRYRDSHRSGMLTATERSFASLTQGAYPALSTQLDKEAEVLLAVDRHGVSKRAAEMSKGTRFQLYLALRAAAHDQLVAQGTRLPFFCDDIFETFDEDRTSAACRVMEAIGGRGQAIYLTHHRHVVEIARSVCDMAPVIHEI